MGWAGAEEGPDGTVGDVASEECGGALEDHEGRAAGYCMGELVSLMFWMLSST